MVSGSWRSSLRPLSKVKAMPRRSASSVKVGMLKAPVTVGLSAPRWRHRPEQVGERPATGRAGGSAFASRASAASASARLASISAGRQPPPGRGVEPPADRFGGAGELGRVRRRVELVHQRRVAKPRGVDRRLAASQLGESLELAILRSQVGQPLEAGGLIRLEGDELFEGLSLGPAIAAAARPTRRQAPATAPWASPKRAGGLPRA